MNQIPDSPDLSQLRRQAKELLTAYRQNAPEARARFQKYLPAAHGLTDAAIQAAGFRLHDAQSCLAREYGFASWTDLKAFVEVVRQQAGDLPALRRAFLGFAYAGEIAGGMNKSRPGLARRLLDRHPDLVVGCATTACAIGDVETVRRAIAADPDWVHGTGGPLSLPPLVAACHSGLLIVPTMRPGIVEVVQLLLATGADPDQSVASRWPPAALAHPDPQHPLSALYGAAGVNFDVGLTGLLLDAGANPNDNESLYHSLDGPTCTELLLQAGARVSGTNALFRCLDFDDLDRFQMLLQHAAGAAELATPDLYFHAIRRRRSLEHFKALRAAGVAASSNAEGVTPAEFALRYGLPEVATLLGGSGELAETDRFLAACAAADREVAEDLLRAVPDMFNFMDDARLQLLPELAAAGAGGAVRLMVELGWPVEVRGGDWAASALNQAVFRGDSELTRVLLAHGASWRAVHGFDDDVSGTLGWASLNQPVNDGDWVGCALALMQHGMPPVRRDPTAAGVVLMEDRQRQFSEEVTAVLLGDTSDGSPIAEA